MLLRRKIKKLIFISLCICIVFFVYAFIEPYWTEVKEVTIVDEDIPDEFNSLKIVFISDIHHGPYFSRDRLKKIVDRINRLSPDIILLGGDYVHRGFEYIAPCFEELKNLDAPLGKYGVLGNHDNWESTELSIKSMKIAGIELLNNTSTWIEKNGQRIKLGGVGDLDTDTQDLQPTIEDVVEEDFVMLLSHNPDYVEHMDTVFVDCVLSGHTHGGQCTLFGVWAPIIPSRYGNKYRTGKIEVNNTTLIVTNGIGTITPPVRFFARPQINVIYLNSERN